MSIEGIMDDMRQRGMIFRDEDLEIFRLNRQKDTFRVKTIVNGKVIRSETTSHEVVKILVNRIFK